jgi:tRNA (guanine37-N1)-methyltransferase
MIFMEESNPNIILLQVPTKFTEDFLKELIKNDYINQNFRIFQLNDKSYIPLIKDPENILKVGCKDSFRIIYLNYLDDSTKEKSELMEELKKNKKSKVLVPSLKEALIGKIPDEYLNSIPRSFDTIGSIAILELNREDQINLSSFSSLIGKTMLENNHALTSVYEKAGDVSGDFRIRELKFIAGNQETRTIHKENGCSFELDISKVFFTPRLVYERNRISNINSEFIEYGLTWDVFCGIGPFIIQIAKKHTEGTYFATDINPEAIKWAKLNLVHNKLLNKIQFYVQNIAYIEESDLNPILNSKVSRFIMNLPEKNLEFLPFLYFAIHPKGALLHIYQFNNKSNSLREAEENLRAHALESKIVIKKVLNSKIVKPFSPALDMTVIDAIIFKKD